MTRITGIRVRFYRSYWFDLKKYENIYFVPYVAHIIFDKNLIISHCP